MTPRPVPTRLAGYEPVAPVEAGRVPTPTPHESEPVPAPVFPPADPVFFYFTDFSPPPIIPAPPGFIPPGEPPCDPEKDPDCKIPPTEPPVEVPEPATSLLLLLGLCFAFYRRRHHDA